MLANDTDADLPADPLTAILVTGPAHGSLTLNPDGTFSYTHDGSETVTDSFTYKVNDGTVDGNTVTVIDHGQSGQRQHAGGGRRQHHGRRRRHGHGSGLGGGQRAGQRHGRGPATDTLTAILVTGPAHGSLTLNADGTFSYTHDGSETRDRQLHLQGQRRARSTATR